MVDEEKKLQNKIVYGPPFHDCPICQTVVNLPAWQPVNCAPGHWFHISCISQWASVSRKVPKCPVCCSVFTTIHNQSGMCQVRIWDGEAETEIPKSSSGLSISSVPSSVASPSSGGAARPPVDPHAHEVYEYQHGLLETIILSLSQLHTDFTATEGTVGQVEVEPPRDFAGFDDDCKMKQEEYNKKLDMFINAGNKLRDLHHCQAGRNYISVALRPQILQQLALEKKIKEADAQRVEDVRVLGYDPSDTPTRKGIRRPRSS